MRPKSVNMSVFTLISKIEILIKSLAKSYGIFFNLSFSNYFIYFQLLKRNRRFLGMVWVLNISL